MAYFSHFSSQFVRWTAGASDLPAWARAVVIVAALPAIALALLSIACMFATVIALFLLVVPVVRLLGRLTGSRATDIPVPATMDQSDPDQAIGFDRGRRQVEARVLD